MTHANTNPLGVEVFGLAMGLGFVLSFGYWCTDFLVIQTAMATDTEENARRVPLIAAIPKMFFPFLVILPGLLAIATPLSASSERIVNGIAVEDAAHGQNVPPGKGLVPVKVDPVSGKVLYDQKGQPLLDYDLAIPNMLLHYFPTGILGLGLTALLASFMSGMAGNVTAFNTVWTYDLYQGYINKGAPDSHYLKDGSMGDGGRNSAVDLRGVCGNFVQQYYGHAAAGIFVCECAAVCDVSAGHVLEANDRARGVYRPRERDGGGNRSPWADAAGGCASGDSWRLDSGGA